MYTLMARLAAAANNVVTRNTDSGFMITSAHTLGNLTIQVVALLGSLNG